MFPNKTNEATILISKEASDYLEVCYLLGYTRSSVEVYRVSEKNSTSIFQSEA
jgi:hypothetical protein